MLNENRLTFFNNGNIFVFFLKSSYVDK